MKVPDIGALLRCARLRWGGDLDYKLGEHPATLTDLERAAHTQRMREITRALGWYTYTVDKLKATMRDDFRIRVARRFAAWRRLDALEARAAGSYEALPKRRSSQMCRYRKVTIRNG
ncbi:hypothetical protein [Bradyrhizobium sp. CCGE-LA001]|uniref:hypothetical protein n=1 Tax=Bradyrhizobium sp. CCGE-LA001 TaxID=1223566 RepID=UPI0011982326|nr:hypothetical protein [Bradyrhizobium sp. CCGE-LA001]